MTEPGEDSETISVCMDFPFIISTRYDTFNEKLLLKVIEIWANFKVAWKFGSKKNCYKLLLPYWAKHIQTSKYIWKLEKAEIWKLEKAEI